MNRTLAPAVLTALALSMVAVPPNTAMATTSVLYAWPAHGHSGDPVYLSGFGLPPHRQLTILMACPNWFAPHVWDYGNAQLQFGPTTDARGDFSGFLLKPFHLNVVQSSGCTIYTSDQQHTFGPDIPALYSIEPDTQLLGSCDTHICARAVARPTRVRAGLYETVNITGGPRGARCDVVVTVPGTRAVKRTVYLTWKVRPDKPDVRFQVEPAARAPARATIQVHCKLGPYQGMARTAFTVLR